MTRIGTSLSTVAALAAIASTTPASASSYHVLHSFNGSDGDAPVAKLINVGGMLYGTTWRGGRNNGCISYGCGTVFSVNPRTGAEKVLHSFSSSEGYAPLGKLINVGGMLYGTTFYGGTANSGTVFSVNLTTGAETVLHSFVRGGDGAYPSAGLTKVRSTLYGTTQYGGTADDGTVFSVNPTTGLTTVVYTFQGGSDGSGPASKMIKVGSTLYGTTQFGGTADNGTVFSVNPTTGGEKVVYSFQGGSDGANPDANVINVQGTLYGTTPNGGGGACIVFVYSGCGTVFSVNPTTGVERVLHSFQGGSDGANPDANVINVQGTLYGTTPYGGGGDCSGFDYSGCGTVFSVNPRTGDETVAYSYSGSDGAAPQAGMINVGGTIYGTTSFGGPNNCENSNHIGCGTVFSYTP